MYNNLWRVRSKVITLSRLQVIPFRAILVRKSKYLVPTIITGGHTKWDLRYTPKPIHFANITNNTGFYLLRSPVIER